MDTELPDPVERDHSTGITYFRYHLPDRGTFTAVMGGYPASSKHPIRIPSDVSLFGCLSSSSTQALLKQRGLIDHLISGWDKIGETHGFTFYPPQIAKILALLAELEWTPDLPNKSVERDVSPADFSNRRAKRGSQ